MTCKGARLASGVDGGAYERLAHRPVGRPPGDAPSTSCDG